MKKYIKPIVCIERFNIVQTGAGRDCWNSIIKDDVTFSDHPCAWEFEGFLLFDTTVPNRQCDVDGEAILCYNNPTAENLMFRS